MQKLFASIRERGFELPGRSLPAPPSLDAIAAVEHRLGVRLPATYRAFVLEMGATLWPVEISGIELLERRAADASSGRPAWFLAFATDGFGNDWGWDLRTGAHDEYRIAFWDHEMGEVAESGPPTSFGGWLEEQVEAVTRVEREVMARARRPRR